MYIVAAILCLCRELLLVLHVIIVHSSFSVMLDKHVVITACLYYIVLAVVVLETLSKSVSKQQTVHFYNLFPCASRMEGILTTCKTFTVHVLE